MGLPGCDVVLHDHMCTSPAQLRRVHAADPAFGLGRFGVVVVASHGGEHRARATMAAHGPTRRCGTRSPAGRRHPRGARRVVSLVDSGEGSPFSLPVPGRPPGGSYGTTVRRGAAVTRGARSGNTASGRGSPCGTSRPTSRRTRSGRRLAGSQRHGTTVFASGSSGTATRALRSVSPMDGVAGPKVGNP